MISVTSASLCWILLSVSFWVSASEDVLNIRAKLGENVILPCQAPKTAPVQVVEWIRPDLNNPTVCVYRGDQCERNNRSSFQNRVQLHPGLVKIGDVSLILKNVKIYDTGTYECHVKQWESRRQRRAGNVKEAELIQPIIHLTVDNSGDEAGPTEDRGDKDEGNKDEGSIPGLEIVLGASAVLFLIGGVVSLLVLKRQGITKHNSDQHPALKADDQQQI
ncbi:hypothetical protein Q5P01_000075 [Channa striata]|uniref:Ig-like domain-containing protein n=1 Tax=Channa striata TaxID=64152 RepID=A0AA88IY77_CHASR|nr:hypothetical protein Q5P01_000075 [Channa striata]